jgi:zinc transport system substrate-binding protein
MKIKTLSSALNDLYQGRLFYIILLLFLTLLTLSPVSPSTAQDVIHVSASILPQKYFIQKIAGDRVQIEIMVLPGANPATYEPKPQQMVALTQASIYFAIGVPFEEHWLKRFMNANPKMAVVHTDQGIEKMALKTKHEHDGDKDVHHEGIKDPHIWLSPPLVMVQASTILKALIENDPSHEPQYRSNYDVFIHDLKTLDQRIKTILVHQPKGASFMVYHPSWGYFADAYGLEQIPIELEGKEPSPRELAGFIHLAKEKNVKAIFVQPQFSMKSAQTIAKVIGAQVVVADPLDPDWAENLLNVAEKFKQALR